MEMERVKDMLCSKGKAVLLSSELAGLGLHVVAPWLQQGCGTSVSSFCDQLGGNTALQDLGHPLVSRTEPQAIQVSLDSAFTIQTPPKIPKQADGLVD